MSPLAWTLPQIQEGESMPVYPGRPLGARPEGLAAANRLELLMRESKSRVLPLTPSRRVPTEGKNGNERTFRRRKTKERIRDDLGVATHGASDGNRTRATCLEGRGSTTELHPHIKGDGG